MTIVAVVVTRMFHCWLSPLLVEANQVLPCGLPRSSATGAQFSLILRWHLRCTTGCLLPGHLALFVLAQQG